MSIFNAIIPFFRKINPKRGIVNISGSGSPEGSVIGYEGQHYINADNNTDVYEKAIGDGTNTGWVQIAGAGAGIPDATTTQPGKVELATQTEAEAGEANNNIAMTPLNVKQAVDAHEEQKIFYEADSHVALSYGGSNIVVEFPTVQTNKGIGLSYSNGVFTLNKDCRLSIEVVISFRNNTNTLTDDTCALEIQKSTDGGITFNTIQKLRINPSEHVNAGNELGQGYGSLIPFDSGDEFRVTITGVSDIQSMVDRIIGVEEQ